ncbi:helix-turn-helix transcriptional regulator [Sedimentibacter sp. MB35-C1]|uniref:helix-turn-helix domain-containing protein n=1 Tax=Sedimentibacter sp. MB35-C1 TaxID=3070995 RepID=UPI0027E11515|nr:helix-turn-helix transcriptional regulator [Sedimentibacter sp. MB35-C1]WMJ77843.1 helix-turn-helix transcriptional regulator [Sedimentibacter sp. MB35-C1]
MINKDNIRFCDLLSELIKNANMTQTAFYTKLGIKKPYFYDILTGKANPPPPQRQFAMIEILEPNESNRILFFELAAQERKEVPADIAKFLENKKNRIAIRKKINYKRLIANGGKENDIK